MDNFLLFPPIFWKSCQMGQGFIWVLFACLCNSSWMLFHPGPFKGCYSETWSRRNIKTSFPNGCSSIFFVESIEGWSKKQDKTLKQTVRSSGKSEWTIEAKAYMIISLVPRRSRLGQSWTLPSAVTSPRDTRPVSYTHLTLPTIYSV